MSGSCPSIKILSNICIVYCFTVDFSNLFSSSEFFVPVWVKTYFTMNVYPVSSRYARTDSPVFNRNVTKVKILILPCKKLIIGRFSVKFSIATIIEFEGCIFDVSNYDIS